MCTCKSGSITQSTLYTKTHWYVTFVDINECLVNNGGCAVTCHNTVGNFMCSCREGLELGQDQRSCKGQIKLSSSYKDQQIYSCNGENACVSFRDLMRQRKLCFSSVNCFFVQGVGRIFSFAQLKVHCVSAWQT